MAELDDTGRAILDAWLLSWSFPAVRDQCITDATGLLPARATQRLNALLDSEMRAVECYLHSTTVRMDRARGALDARRARTQERREEAR